MNALANALLTPPSVIWFDAAGKSYNFYLHPIGTRYHPWPGVYIFCRQAANGNWDAVYVGETDDFSRRITDELRHHHQWDSIIRCGATHICTLHVPSGYALRQNIETDLRHSLNPPCNCQ